MSRDPIGSNNNTHHSTTAMWDTTVPSCLHLIRQSMRVSNFCLNTLAIKSGLSSAYIPGARLLWICFHLGLPVRVMKKVGGQYS